MRIDPLEVEEGFWIEAGGRNQLLDALHQIAVILESLVFLDVVTTGDLLDG